MDPHKLPPLSEFYHSVDLQIRFNDIDILGHLNNTVYFSFYDTGKAYFFEHLMGKMDWQRVESVIANVDCCYIAPIYFGEEVAVYSRCAAVYDRSFVIQQVIVEKRTGEIKSAAETVMVSFDPATKKSKDMRPEWREALLRASGQK